MKIFSAPVPEHGEVPLPDDGELEALIDYWTDRGAAPSSDIERKNNVCYVASVGRERNDAIRRAQLAEITSLVRNQGDEVSGEEIVFLSKPNPRTLLGKGAAEALARRARETGANLLVLDAELSATQLRNLEDAAGISVCDREAVILNVFLRNARTARSRIQIAIAQLEYLRPRIRGVGINMDQQTGGIGGGRGPGETASELLARKIDSRLLMLTKELRRVESASRTQRRNRENCKRIAIIGYTNAGKTSLMNALTSESLSAKDMPFETLDTTSRALSRHGGDVLLSDTVGFIRRLPERLLGSFESTLAEIAEADLLLIVVDSSDPERELHVQTTEEVIARLGADQLPRLYIFNKADKLAVEENSMLWSKLSHEHPFVLISTSHSTAVEELRGRLLQMARASRIKREFLVPYHASAVFSQIYAGGRVITSEATESGLRLTVEVNSRLEAKILKSLEEVE